MTAVSNNARVIVACSAKDLGITLTDAGELAIGAKVDVALKYERGEHFLADASGQRLLKTDDAGGMSPVSFAEFVAGAAKADPTYLQAKPDKAPTAVSADATLTERMKAHKEAAKANNPAGKRTADAVKGNPWERGRINLTEQMILAKYDPARAQRLKALAGVAR